MVSNKKKRKGVIIMSEKISLKGLKKHMVLAALYNAARPKDDPASLSEYNSKPMSVEWSWQILEKRTKFDCIKGRVLNIDLSGDKLDPCFYDLENGAGTAKRVIESMIQSGDVNNAIIVAIHKSGTNDRVLYLGDKLGAFSKK